MIAPETRRALREGVDFDRHAACVKLTREIDALLADAAPQETVHILRNYSAEPLAPYLRMFAGLDGWRLDTRVGDFDTYVQELIQPDSDFNADPPSLVVLTLMLEALFGRERHPDSLSADEVIGHLAPLLDRLESGPAKLVFVTTFLPGLTSWGGESGAETAARANAFLRERAAASPKLMVIDLADIVAAHGRAAALDQRAWFLFNQPFAPVVFRDLARAMMRHVRQLRGGARKAVVLDCDNTLWGGVLGEDGPEGIKLDPAEYPGNVFHAVQRMLVELSRRGVLVCLCSKNNEADVLRLMAEHPAMLLKEEHLAGWRINWENKAQNLIDLAAELNIGLDAMVMVDDNPAELRLIGEALPDVDCLAVPETLVAYPAVLAAYDGFPLGRSTAEDAERTAQYRVQRERAAAATDHVDIDAYLAGLQMTAEIAVDRPQDVARAAQLTQKTNQFNLTTRRYAEAEVAAFVDDPDAALVTLTLRDRFGASGLTGIAVAVREADAVRIDTLLMSCRILGRRLEDVLLRETLATAAARWGVARVNAAYLPTAKNGQTAAFFDDRGLEATAGADGAKAYSGAIDALTYRDISMVEVVRDGGL